MTQGTRRPNQMEFKARPNIAGECLYLLPFPWYFENLKAEVKIEVSSSKGICIYTSVQNFKVLALKMTGL